MWKKNVKFHISIYRIVQNQCERWNMYKMCKVQTGREVCAIYNLGWFIMVWIWSFETGFAWNTASCRLRNNSCLSHTYDTSVIMSHWVKLWGSNNLVTWPQWDRKSTQLGSKLWPMCGFNTVGFDGFNPSPRGSKKWYNWKPETRILSTFQTTNGDVPKHVFTSVMFGSHMSHMYLFVHKHSIVISWMWKKWKNVKKKIHVHQICPEGKSGSCPLKDSRQSYHSFLQCVQKKSSLDSYQDASSDFLASSSVLQLLLSFLHFPNHAYCLGYDVGQAVPGRSSFDLPIKYRYHNGYSLVRKKMIFILHHVSICFPLKWQNTSKYIEAATCYTVVPFFCQIPKSPPLTRWPLNKGGSADRAYLDLAGFRMDGLFILISIDQWVHSIYSWISMLNGLHM